MHVGFATELKQNVATLSVNVSFTRCGDVGSPCEDDVLVAVAVSHGHDCGERVVPVCVPLQVEVPHTRVELG